ncbi:hypothetical transcriptional regulator [Moritella sp. PE36]|nr:hypothetical transcriptional regulator [Moritella sp. PE36]
MKAMKQDKAVFFKQSKALPFVEMRQASRSNACYQGHTHDEFSFGVIDTGIADYNNLNQHNRIGQGDTVTINPGDIHSCNPTVGDWSYRMLFVDTGWVGELQAEISGIDSIDYSPFTNPYLRSQQAYGHFDLLFTNLLLESNALSAEALLIEYMQQHWLTKDLEKSAHTHIHRVKEMIADQLDVNHSLTDLAQESGLSRFHLLRTFKQTYGLSPHAFQLDERIKSAKTLLKSGYSIIDTSIALGFADQSHLQRNFKKRLAVTPKQYQSFFV